MAKINFIDVYKDRIKQAELDMKKAISSKNWSELAKLQAEKQRIEVLIDKG